MATVSGDCQGEEVHEAAFDEQVVDPEVTEGDELDENTVIVAAAEIETEVEVEEATTEGMEEDIEQQTGLA
ncbi:hypothetical protein BG004_006953 [Podila humilis]|nr:hypothetical protein BG004_006953 [Podila humilis]